MFGNIFNQSVPGQFYHVHLDGGKTVLAEPSEHLSNAVFYYWFLNIEADEVNLEIIPDGAIDLVVSPQIDNFSIIYPPTIKKFTIPLEGPITYAGISFEPEAAQQYFAKDINAFSSLEQGAATVEALNLESLVEKVQGVTDISRIKEIFDHELEANKLQVPKKLGLSAYQCFVDKLDAGSVQKVTKEIGLSERQFRRTIYSISGLSPKKVQRIVRLQQLLHELFTSESFISEDGFYDDAHRIKELKELAGLTYGEIRKMSEIYNESL